MKQQINRLSLLILATTSLVLASPYGCDRRAISNVAWLQSECDDCTEAQLGLCLDGEDGDGDGLMDCEDPDCQEFCVEDTKARCTDGVDNDQDGLTDCRDDACQVPGLCCPETPTDDESGTAACSDGIDNNCNGHLDCDDWSCGAEAFCEGNDITCADGIDNDNDGFTDCGDYSCSKSNDVTVCTGQ